jgi:hypothetical protein
VLPRAMDQEEVVELLGDGWQLEEVRSVATDDMPRPVRKAEPTGYRVHAPRVRSASDRRPRRIRSVRATRSGSSSTWRYVNRTTS